MNVMENQIVDRISNLPIPILHQILSILPARDVARTCILSKHWHSTRFSFPILEFDLYEFRSLAWGSIRFKNEAFFRWVDVSVQRLYATKTTFARLKVTADIIDPRILRAIERSIERNVQELDLAFHLLFTRFNHQQLLYSARSVVVYKLGGVHLSLPDLLRGCPLVQELRLRNCVLEKTAIVTDAKNLKTVAFKNCYGMTYFVIQAPKLESFTYSGGSLCAIDITQTSSLEYVNLGHILISDEWLENLVRGCPKLQFLKINCNVLERIVICHEKLKTLKLFDWTRNGLVKIDTPELLHFTFSGTAKPFYLFNHSTSLEATLNLFRIEQIDERWFSDLRKMLQWFSECENLELVPDIYAQDVIFGMDIRDNSIPLLYGLKNLEIQLPIWPRNSSPCIKLIDTYLWLCPHLETLKITSEGTEEVVFKFEQRDMPLCCVEHPGECWKFSVKKVTLTSYVGRKADKKWLLSYFQRFSTAMETLEDLSDHSKLVVEESPFLSGFLRIVAFLERVLTSQYAMYAFVFVGLFICWAVQH